MVFIEYKYTCIHAGEEPNSTTICPVCQCFRSSELLKEINVALPLVIALSLTACKPLVRIHLLEVFCLRITYGRLTLKP